MTDLLVEKGSVRRAGSSFVFPSLAGTKIIRRNLLRAFYAAVKGAEMTGFRFQDLRHTFATRLVQAGVDLLWRKYSKVRFVNQLGVLLSIVIPLKFLSENGLLPLLKTPIPGDFMDWKRILAHISGSVNEALLLRIEYLVSENRKLRDQIKGRLLVSDAERMTLAEIGKRLGRKALEEIASIVKPETILGWHRQLIAKKFDGSKNRTYPGRPRTEANLEKLIVRMAQENRSWGYDRIVGALNNLGYKVSDNTVGNILKRNGLAPAPVRKKTSTWKEFIRTHLDLLFGTDFFTAEVWTLHGLVTFYVHFFIRVSSREVHITGITPHPDESWISQIARNVTMEGFGFLKSGDFVIHDRDRKFCAFFQQIIESVGIRRIALPPQSPNLNAFAERWV